MTTDKNFFKHHLADVQSMKIGLNTKIWQFVVVLEGATIGEECNVCSHCFIENDVVIGNRVTIKNGVQIWDGLRIEDDVFIGPNATLTNDMFPHRRDDFVPLPTLIKKGATIGANATIVPGITIGESAIIGAGAVVTKDVPDRALVVGNPAKVIRILTDTDNGN